MTAKASHGSRQVREHPLFQQPLTPYLSHNWLTFFIDFLKYLFSFILQRSGFTPSQLHSYSVRARRGSLASTTASAHPFRGDRNPARRDDAVTTPLRFRLVNKLLVFTTSTYKVLCFAQQKAEADTVLAILRLLAPRVLLASPGFPPPAASALHRSISMRISGFSRCCFPSVS